MIDQTAAPIRRIIPDPTFSTETDLSTARMPMDTARSIRDAGIEFRRTDAYWRVRALTGNLSRSCSSNDRSMASRGRKGNFLGKT
jgi:hypothetical protein